jgi:hypothetical protein
MLAVALILGPAAALAQVVDTTLWGTDNYVRAIARDGSTIYIAGDFTKVQVPTGGGAPLSAASGELVRPFPRVVGNIYATVPDGARGWYIGGNFTAVGGAPRQHLAHILADGSVDAWDPEVTPCAHCDVSDFGIPVVSALAVSGSTVYVGGYFAGVDGQPRNDLAAVDATTGAPTSWNPNANDEVKALTVSGSTVYAGGKFTSIGGLTRSRIAALDSTTGIASAWNPVADSTVYALAVSGGVVYASGDFTSIGGLARNHIAALDAETGSASGWNPNANATVLALLPSASTVYASGSFTIIGGQTRSRIAALDSATGTATPWSPSANAAVRALATNGGVIYAGGDFSNLGGQTRDFLAALDATTGAATAWNPDANQDVYALALSGSTVYAGGAFTAVGGVARRYIAALDAATGEPTAWNPDANGRLQCLVVGGGVVYAGGYFTNIGGQARSYIAALDATTGAATPWNPSANGRVAVLALSGSTVYAGGTFTTIGGQARSRIAALDATTGSATGWNPSANSTVRSLLPSGSTVYVGGTFTSIGGPTRNRIAALDATTGAATPWNPNANGDVYALASSGSTVYVGGGFSQIGGQSRSLIAALDATTGAATEWNPNIVGELAYVECLVSSGNLVYVGGHFGYIGGYDLDHRRTELASVDATTGQVTDWRTGLGDYCPIYAMVKSGSTLYVGGYFSYISGQPQSCLAAYDLSEPVPVLISLVSAQAQPDRVRLTWYATAGGTRVARIDRRTIDSDWRAIASITADGTGRLAYEDREVSAGTRYGYRLAVGLPGQEQFSGETWVDVPRVAALALTGLRPNPAARDLRVAFSLPDASPARLEMLDVAGRIVLARQVGGLGAGNHVVDLPEGRALPAGIYVLRLTQSGRSLLARGTIIR